MDLTLLVMAAGIGSRYGGLKQLDAFGPNRETILDYSLYDAILAGFSKIIFVIRKDIEEEFRSTLFKRISPHVKIDWVYQEIDVDIPANISIPKERKKPWGTGHAVLAAHNKIKEPFAVINADDFYGKSSYQIIANFLRNNPSKYALVAYPLKKTLSAHGSVSRGICNIDSSSNLQSITEYTRITKDEKGHLIAYQSNGTLHLTGNEKVSLNLWGLQIDFFDYLKKKFQDFLVLKGQDLDSEFYLPSVIDNAIHNKFANFSVLSTKENYFGVTYKEDKATVRKKIQEKINMGEYPSNLWR